MNWPLLINSLLVSGLTTLLAVSFGFFAALWMTSLEKKWRNCFLAVAIIALALPPFLVTNSWLDLLGETGALRRWLPFNIFSLGGTVLVLSLMFWPIPTLAAWSAWTRLERAQLESEPAMRGRALLRHLLMPLARPTLGLAAVLTFVLALNNFAVPSLLLASSQQKIYPAEVWIRFTTNFDARGALLLSWPMILAPLILLALLWRRDVWWPRTQGAVEPGVFRRQLGAGWFWFCGAIAILIAAFSVAVPLAELTLAKRTWTELLPSIAAGKFAAWNSFFLAAVAATVAVGVSLMIGARSIAPQGSRGAMLRAPAIGAALWLLFLIPGVLLGIAWIQIFNRPLFAAFYQSTAIVVFAFVVRYLAFAWNGVAHALQSVDRDLTDAARVEGASRWQLFRHVHWPQIAPQIAGTWYVIYLLCLWDVESIVLIQPPGCETLALRIFNFLHYGHNAQVNALSLTLLGLAIVPFVIWQAAKFVQNKSSNIQHPTSREASSSKAQTTARVNLFGIWCLKFLWCLVLGAWCFSFVGCSLQSASNESRVESKIFARVEILGTRGVAPGQFNKPRALTVDLQDNLYVADITGRVQKFSPDGKYLLQWQMPQTDLGRPKGMGLDADGNIIVIEPHYQRVNHFSTDGKLVAQWGMKGTNVGQFTLPRAVVVNSKKEIFVCEYTTVERVQKFVISPQGLGVRQSSGAFGSSNALEKRQRTAAVQDAGARSSAAEFVASFGKPGTAEGEFNRPEGLAVDTQDRLYVADSCNQRVQIFSSGGKWLKSFGKAGSGRGEFSYPHDVRVDEAGRIYVCEYGGSRIQIFDADCKPIEILGAPGFAPGQFNEPWAIALDSRGNLYVADALNHRVQKFLRRQTVARASSPLFLASRQKPSGDSDSYKVVGIFALFIPCCLLFSFTNHVPQRFPAGRRKRQARRLCYP